MRKIRFEWCEYLDVVNVTHWKVYDVVNYVVETNGDIMIEIFDDDGRKRKFHKNNKYSAKKSPFIFIEVTTEYRNSIIDGILR